MTTTCVNCGEPVKQFTIVDDFWYHAPVGNITCSTWTGATPHVATPDLYSPTREPGENRG